MVKILHILNEIRPSGAEVMIKTASPFWAQHGIELHALSTGNVPGSYASSFETAGITVHHIPFANSFSFFFRALNLMRSTRFDVIHIHTERAALSYTLLARLAGTRTIFRTIHNNFLFTGATRITRTIRRWIATQLGAFHVSISNIVAKNELNRLKNPTYVIYNWYDNKRFYPPPNLEKKRCRKELGVSENEKIIVSVGNCSKVKNHAVIFEALSCLDSKSAPVLYFHIGEEDAERSEKKLAKKLNIEQQCYFLGKQTDVRSYLWAADVFVMPSLYEGFSIAALEALACNLHLIIANSPGLQELTQIFPEILITNCSPEDLSQSIQRSLTLPIASDRAEKLKPYSINHGAQMYYELYKRSTR